MEIITTYHFSPELDSELLEEIYEGDLDYTLCMFQTYVETLGEELDSLEKVSSLNQVAEIRKIVHKIKPNFSMVGLPTLYHQAVNLEKICDREEGSSQDLAESLESFLQKARYSSDLIEKESSKIEQFLDEK